MFGHMFQKEVNVQTYKNTSIVEGIKHYYDCLGNEWRVETITNRLWRRKPNEQSFSLVADLPSKFYFPEKIYKLHLKLLREELI